MAKDKLHAEIERAYNRSWKYYVKIKNERDDDLAFEASDWLIVAVWYAYTLLYKERRKLKNKSKKGATWTIR